MSQPYDKKLAAEYSRLAQSAQALCRELAPHEHYYHQLDLLARFGPPLEPSFQYLVGAYRTFSNLAVLLEDYARSYRTGSGYDRTYTIYRAQCIPIMREQIILLRAMIQHLPRLKTAMKNNANAAGNHAHQ